MTFVDSAAFLPSLLFSVNIGSHDRKTSFHLKQIPISSAPMLSQCVPCHMPWLKLLRGHRRTRILPVRAIHMELHALRVLTIVTRMSHTPMTVIFKASRKSTIPCRRTISAATMATTCLNRALVGLPCPWRRVEYPYSSRWGSVGGSDGLSSAVGVCKAEIWRGSASMSDCCDVEMIVQSSIFAWSTSRRVRCCASCAVCVCLLEG